MKFVNTVFCSAPIHASKQMPKLKIKIKNCAKIQISKPKRVKINTTWLNSGSKGHNIFIATKAKTLTRYGQKVNFLIQPLNRVNFGSRRAFFFPFEMIVYGPKSELNRLDITKIPKTLIKISLFKNETNSFWADFMQSNEPIGQELERSNLTILKNVLDTFH